MLTRHSCTAKTRARRPAGLAGFVAATALVALAACEASQAAPQRPANNEPRAAPAVTPLRAVPGKSGSDAGGSRIVQFEGACDASGAAPLAGGRFVVADDEDNVLRVYDAERGGSALYAVDVSPQLDLRKRKRAESDIEAATLLGSEVYFLSSHARTKKGKADPDRSLLFATQLPIAGQPLKLVGTPYRRLLQDLLADPRLAAFQLAAAAERAPKELGGLNLEGLTAAPDGSFLLGFRNPVPGGKALLLTLLNPRGVLHGERARFAAPELLDLEGLGIRSLTYWGMKLLIAAGSATEGGPFRVYHYDRKSPPTAVTGVDWADLTLEGFVSDERREQILLLSDDGNRDVGGTPCKKLDNARDKRFRGIWLSLPR
jgi:hypothetical protein